MPELIDPFGRRVVYLRLSVTDRCDFRCFYCIPKGFKEFTEQERQLSPDEFTRLIRIFSEMGVSKVRLTGGEPLVRRDIVELAQRIKALPLIQDLSLSTNASRLAEFAAPLHEAGVSRINVSLDSLNPTVFREITHGDLEPVLAGLQAAKAAGFGPIKINMVVMRDLNLGEVGEMVNYCLTNGFTLRFIETMPVGVAGQMARDRYISLTEVRRLLEQRFELEPATMHGGGPADYVRIRGSDLKIGFITPISQHFCERCNRVRLSSEGTLYLCLGQQDRLELRPMLRDGASDDEIKAAILDGISHKPERHEFDSNPENIVRVMSLTGG